MNVKMPTNVGILTSMSRKISCSAELFATPPAIFAYSLLVKSSYEMFQFNAYYTACNFKIKYSRISMARTPLES